MRSQPNGWREGRTPTLGDGVMCFEPQRGSARRDAADRSDRGTSEKPAFFEFLRPNGPSFLSPARQVMRPNGLRYLRAMFNVSRPFRPQILPGHIPGRWPGLRNYGPLGLENGNPGRLDQGNGNFGPSGLENG